MGIRAELLICLVATFSKSATKKRDGLIVMKRIVAFLFLMRSNLRLFDIKDILTMRMQKN